MRGGIDPIDRVSTPSFMDRRAVGKPLVFVSYGGTIDIFRQGGNNKLVGEISGPTGLDLATDAAGNLYSANQSFSSSSVTVYAPPYTSGPILTLPGGIGVAVSRRGVVAVEGCTMPGSQCGLGVQFYAAGSTTPCATVLVDQSIFSDGLSYASFDRKENLYIIGVSAGTFGPVYAKIDGGCNAKKAKMLTTANTIAFAGSIRVDSAGRIAILAATADQNVLTIDTFDPPKGGSLGSPVSTSPLPGTVSNYSGAFAFQATGRGIWAGYGGVPPSNDWGASEFAYPAGGAPEKTVVDSSQAITYGVAVTPPLVP